MSFLKSFSFIMVIFSFVSSNAIAETFTIEMLNKLGKERMVYSEKVISINTNDEILWKQTSL